MDYKHKPADNEVLQYLLSQDADVVCLQEVDVYKDAENQVSVLVLRFLGL